MSNSSSPLCVPFLVFGNEVAGMVLQVVEDEEGGVAYFDLFSLRDEDSGDVS